MSPRRLLFATNILLVSLFCLISSTSTPNLNNSAPFSVNLFPSQDEVGYPGPTTLGAQPSLIRSQIQPVWESHYPILDPESDDNSTHFNSIRSWGNLSPVCSLPPSTFGIRSSPALPEHCSLEQVHVLHRHGARYPTTRTHLPSFGQLIQSAQNNGSLGARDKLEFLNHWKYQLGTETLTPFGRSQMFQLGVAYQQKYGFLLEKSNYIKPVFRTTSQDRMYHSSLNFAAGFFGIPAAPHYHQSILIEQNGFNNSLAAYYACPSSQKRENSVQEAVRKWKSIYLSPVVQRLNSLIAGVQFSTEDVYAMQQLCSYETVALGSSRFCPLFTEKEWLDFAYANDLDFWYSSSFGSPLSPAIGLGWTEELLSRLSKKSITHGHSSVNVTLDGDPRTFPLDQPIYVDATHDTVISAVITTLNFTSLTASGPPPSDHRPGAHSFQVQQIVPFGAHLSAQVMRCHSTKYIRFILNDAIVPLDGLKPCEKDLQTGLCTLEKFIEGLENRIQEIDYQKVCF